MKPEDLGIKDIEAKWVVRARFLNSEQPAHLLWRTTGKRSKPLPNIGSIIDTPAGAVIVTAIDEPGSLVIDDNHHTVVVNQR